MLCTCTPVGWRPAAFVAGLSAALETGAFRSSLPMIENRGPAEVLRCYVYIRSDGGEWRWPACCLDSMRFLVCSQIYARDAATRTAEEYQVSGADTHSSHSTSVRTLVHSRHLLSHSCISSYQYISYMADGCISPRKAMAISKKGKHLLTAVHLPVPCSAKAPGTATSQSTPCRQPPLLRWYVPA